MERYETLLNEIQNLTKALAIIKKADRCQWCDLQLEDNPYCPLTGVKHLTSVECEMLINETADLFPFPDSTLETFPQIKNVLHFHAFSHLFDVPEGALQDATVWLRTQFCRLLVPKKSEKDPLFVTRKGSTPLDVSPSFKNYT